MQWNWPGRRFADRRFERDLLATKGDDDAVVAEEITRILYADRRRQAWQPWLDMLRSIERIIDIFVFSTVRKWYGQYRSSGKKVDSGSDQIAGSCTGPGAATVAPVNPTPSQYATPPPFVPSTQAPPAAEPITHAGIRAGEIVAYRAWFLHEGRLRSVYRDNVWEPGVVMEGNPDNEPEGVHGYKSVLDLVKYVADFSDHYRAVVTGKVHLWGNVVEHERGYRAQYASIVAIDDSPHYDAQALRDLYCPVRKRRRKPKEN